MTIVHRGRERRERVIPVLGSLVLIASLVLGHGWSGAAAGQRLATWTQIVPPPGVGVVSGIECYTSTECFSGNSTSGNNGSASLGFWNGSTLTATGPTNPVIPNYASGDLMTFANAISCPSRTTCLAVGGLAAPVASSLHDGFWSDFLPLVGVLGQQMIPDALACLTRNDCWAVGGEPGGKYQNRHPTVIHYDGESWSAVQSPQQHHASDQGALTSIACPAKNSCWAAGEYTSLHFTSHGILEHWNGSKWLLVAGSQTIYPYGIACDSPEACTEVGTVGQRIAAIQIHGSSLQPVRLPARRGILLSVCYLSQLRRVGRLPLEMI